MFGSISRRMFLASMGFAGASIFIGAEDASGLESGSIIPIVTYGDNPSDDIGSARSWYGDSFVLNGGGTYRSALRMFDGGSVGVELEAFCQDADATFSVSLLRGGALLGTSTLRAGGFVRAEWPNAAPGYFQFEFRNLSGYEINCENVAMFSW